MLFDDNRNFGPAKQIRINIFEPRSKHEEKLEGNCGYTEFVYLKKEDDIFGRLVLCACHVK